MSTARSLKGSLGLRGASIGDSCSLADSSDVMAFSTLKSSQEVAEKLATPSVTLNYQDWMGFDFKEEEEVSKSLPSTGWWMEALKEVRERSREKKRWSFILVHKLRIFDSNCKCEYKCKCDFILRYETLMPMQLQSDTNCKWKYKLKSNAKCENAEN